MLRKLKIELATTVSATESPGIIAAKLCLLNGNLSADVVAILRCAWTKAILCEIPCKKPLESTVFFTQSSTLACKISSSRTTCDIKFCVHISQDFCCCCTANEKWGKRFTPPPLEFLRFVGATHPSVDCSSGAIAKSTAMEIRELTGSFQSFQLSTHSRPAVLPFQIFTLRTSRLAVLPIQIYTLHTSPSGGPSVPNLHPSYLPVRCSFRSKSSPFIAPRPAVLPFPLRTFRPAVLPFIIFTLHVSRPAVLPFTLDPWLTSLQHLRPSVVHELNPPCSGRMFGVLTRVLTHNRPMGSDTN